MILTASPSAADRRVRTCHGGVTGEASVATNIFKDLLAKIRGIVRSAGRPRGNIG